MLSGLDPQRYTPRIYLVSSGDSFSADKARAHESRIQAAGAPIVGASEKRAPSAGDTATRKSDSYEIVTLPRARAVKQSLLTTPFTLAISLLACIKVIVLVPLWRRWKTGRRKDGLFAELVLLNGPGTCVPIVIAVYLLRVSSICASCFRQSHC